MVIELVSYLSFRHISEIEILIEGLIKGPQGKYKVRWTEEKGRGVHTLNAVKKGEFVLEYEVHRRHKR